MKDAIEGMLSPELKEEITGTAEIRETFKFDPIKDYIKELINNEIIIIPNSSKTEKEIEKFNEELGLSFLIFQRMVLQYMD